MAKQQKSKISGPGQKGPEVSLPFQWQESDAPGGYADFIHMAVNERKFVLDFGQIDPFDRRKITRTARVVMHPQTASDLLVLLARQIASYEERFERKIVPDYISFKIEEKEGD